ncbi:unnamed protein product, partial [Symbiodinium sp. KB8]
MQLAFLQLAWCPVSQKTQAPPHATFLVAGPTTASVGSVDEEKEFLEAWWTAYALSHAAFLIAVDSFRFLAPLRGSTRAEEQQVPFVARIVNASGTGCGACDRRNCT